MSCVLFAIPGLGFFETAVASLFSLLINASASQTYLPRSVAQSSPSPRVPVMRPGICGLVTPHPESFFFILLAGTSVVSLFPR